MTLASTVPPWVIVARPDDAEVRAALAAMTTDGVVRHLRGAHMSNPAAVFAEFADKLEFPPYFGHNWYALVDCLDDLHGSWHGRRPVVVVVESADDLATRDFFPLLVALLCEAAERANLSLDADGQPRTRPPFPLHFVFFVESPPEVARSLSSRDDLTCAVTDNRLDISATQESR
ncbi:barstar family protein [Asanoa siamensis]|uniref:Barstar (barnase inhibitor) domain-containing protein n=1 Tax=Asanoa siamensis TaxID=926357 RepID=A0ABQ4CZ47_9ACTN|nr:barstar family protein [Asanoa siamensis]GIF76557.1 hypothetical protein Asi02nite_60750 [Asanoa siamensis]